MKRETSLLATLIVVVLLVAAPAWPQAPANHPAPTLPEDILGPQLIAWSQVQQPRPIADAIPADQQTTQQAAQQSADSAAEQGIGAETRTRPATQTFTGIIVKDGARYVLKASSVVYELDDQDRSRKYEGKQVRVKGVLDAKGSDVHVVDIELIS
jgi:S1-C subfamily serine protease